MRAIILAAFLLVVTAFLSSGAYAGMEDRVVNIIVTAQKQDYASPWQRGNIARSMVTGCVIAGNRILTSAYSLTDHAVIEVMKKEKAKNIRPGSSSTIITPAWRSSRPKMKAFSRD